MIGFAGTDNKGLGGLEVEYDKKLAGRTGKQTIVRDPFGRAIDVVSATPERQGRDVFTHDRPLDPGERRGRAARDDQAVACARRDRGRARPAQRSSARDGAGAGL